MKIVLQRDTRPGEPGNATGDCFVACLATVLGHTYEQAATLLGLEISTDGFAIGTDDGLTIPEVVDVLDRSGFAALVLLAQHPLNVAAKSPKIKRDLRLPASDEVKERLNGLRAIVGIALAHGETHCCVWDGSQVLDLRRNAASPRTGDDLVFALAVYSMTRAEMLSRQMTLLDAVA